MKASKYALFAMPLVLMGCTVKFDGPITGLTGGLKTDLTNTSSSSTDPSSTPAATASSSPTSPTATGILNGRFSYMLGQGNSPGRPLFVELKRKMETTGSFSKTGKNVMSDNDGRASFTELVDGDYQMVFDDKSQTATTDSKMVGILVTDPTTLQSGQASPSILTSELAWDFSSGASPATNATVSAGNVTFSFPSKPGFEQLTYQVTVFSSQDTSYGAIVSSVPDTAAASSVFIPVGSAGIRYYVVKFWKTGGSFGGGNPYGQTKPIPFIVQ